MQAYSVKFQTDVYIRGLYQYIKWVPPNARTYICILNYHFINTIRHSNMFQPLKGHLQGVQLINSSSVGQENESPVLKFWKSSKTYLQVNL
jgi:hypothetical protein